MCLHQDLLKAQTGMAPFVTFYISNSEQQTATDRQLASFIRRVATP